MSAALEFSAAASAPPQQAALINLAPMAELLLLAMALAALPLGWWIWRSRGQSPARRWRALAVLTCFLTFDLIVFGSFTRLTDSGLGCPDWPGCYGNASPFGARHEIAQAEAALPSGPVTHTKAWIEMVHRYLAMVVGALILTMTLWAIWMRRKGHAIGWVAPVVALVWVCVQGAFGKWTVTLKLYPAIVTMHLLLGLGLLALLMTMTAEPGRARTPWPRALRRGLALISLAIGVQIALGGWVSTNYAVLACSEFPKCQGVWWPAMNFGEGFEILRPLGAGSQGGYLPFEALTAIHMAHRIGALVVFALMLAVAWALWVQSKVWVNAGRLAEATPMRRTAQGLVLLAAWQALTGVSNVVLGWPILAALGHSGGAAVLVVLLSWALSRTASASPGSAALGAGN
jgi:cytochrome c oxidase assembly protein subunit 15